MESEEGFFRGSTELLGKKNIPAQLSGDLVSMKVMEVMKLTVVFDSSRKNRDGPRRPRWLYP